MLPSPIFSVRAGNVVGERCPTDLRVRRRHIARAGSSTSAPSGNAAKKSGGGTKKTTTAPPPPLSTTNASSIPASQPSLLEQVLTHALNEAHQDLK